MRTPILDPSNESTRSVKRSPFGRTCWTVLALVLLTLATGCGGDKEEAIPPMGTEAMVPAETPVATPRDSITTEEPASQDVGNQVVGNQDRDLGVGSTPADHPAASEPVMTATHPSESMATSETGRFSVQLGSFQNSSYARARSEKVRAAGYEPVIETVLVAGVTYHRILVRGISDRVSAEAIGDDLGHRLDITYLIKRAD